jgi:CHAT domain-containing protein
MVPSFGDYSRDEADGKDRSRFRPTRIPCPTCLSSMNGRIWPVVDGEFRRDLLDEIGSGEINVLHCGECDSDTEIDIAMWVLGLSKQHPCILSPHPNIPSDTRLEQEILLDALGPDVCRELAKQRVTRLSRAFLRHAVIPADPDHRPPLDMDSYTVEARALAVFPNPQQSLAFVIARMGRWRDEARELIEAMAAQGDGSAAAAHAKRQLHILDHAEDLYAKRAESDPVTTEFLNRLVEADRSGDEGKIAALIDFAPEIDKIISPKAWATFQSILGKHCLRTKAPHSADGVEQAVKHFEAALDVTIKSFQPDEWLQRSLLLARALILRNDRNGDDLEEAIEILRRIAFAVRVRSTSQIDKIFFELGRAFLRRRRGSLRHNFGLSIHYFEHCLRCSEASGYRATVLVSVVRELRPLMPEADNSLIEFARRLVDEAMTDRSANSIDDLAIRMDIVSGLSQRLSRFGTKSGAISSLKAALASAVRSNNRLMSVRLRVMLATTFLDRTDGDPIETLDAAGGYAIDALTEISQTEKPEQWVFLQLIILRAQITKEPRGTLLQNDDIFKRLSMVESQLRTLSGTEAASLLLSLAHIYRLLIARQHDRSQDAVSAYRQAIAHIDRDREPYLWAMAQGDLGGALLEYNSGNRLEILLEAANAIEDGLVFFTREKRPFDWALANHELARIMFERSQLGEAVQELGFFHANNALEIFTRERYPRGHVHLQTLLGDQHLRRKSWKEAAEAYRVAIDVRDQIDSEVYSREGQELYAADRQDLHALAAYAYLQLGDVSSASKTVDVGRARILTSALRVTNPEDAPDVDRTLAEAARTARKELDEANRRQAIMRREDPAEQRDAVLNSVKKARAKFKDALARIGRPDGLESWQPSIIRSATPKGGAVVQLTTTREGSFAIIHIQDANAPPKVLWLDEFSSKDIERWLHGSNSGSGWLEAQKKQQRDVQAFQVILRHLCRDLWDRLIGPVAEELQKLDLRPHAQIVFLAGGMLATLPLHAATRIVDGQWRSFLEDFIVSYAPSASVLQSCLSERRAHEPSERMLLINNPGSDLPFADLEVEAVARLLEGSQERVVASKQAGAGVLPLLPNQAYIHFACHGHFDWLDPLASSLEISQEISITLRQILSGAALRAQLVFLSACETGISDVNRVPEEFIGFRSAFLEVGARSVIGTLWRVPDLSTMFLIHRFYNYYFNEGYSAASALREAQIWLRSMSGENLNLELNRIREGLENVPIELRSELDDLARELTSLREIRPFEHPYYWAAFALSGAW